MTLFRSISRALVPAMAVLAPVACECAAQTVQGVIVGEKSLTPIGNASLSLVDDSGHVASTATTDSATGMFYLDVPRAGRYQLKIRVGRGGLSFSPFFSVDSNQTVEHKFAVPEWPAAVLEAYLPEDVTKQVAQMPGVRSPRYPDALRARERSGLVRAQFVVDTAGKPVANTIRVTESDDDAFTRALRDYLNGARFYPAERDGLKVPQVSEVVIDFGFGTEPPRASGMNVILVRALGVYRVAP